MKVHCIAQVEDSAHLEEQIAKQTVQPDYVNIHIDQDPAVGIDPRRKRIAQNHRWLEEVVEETDADLIWQVEGDCVLPDDCLERLLADYNLLKKESPIAYVSGVQVGRHGIYAIGAWHFNDDRTEFKSLDHNFKGIKEVDATGFYCLLAGRDAWLDGVCTWEGERWGPDVNWGLSLRDKGYSIFADADIKIGHKTEGGIIDPDEFRTCNVTFYQDGDTWRYQTS